MTAVLTGEETWAQTPPGGDDGKTRGGGGHPQATESGREQVLPSQPSEGGTNSADTLNLDLKTQNCEKIIVMRRLI